jgi:hypothetical protein
LAGGGAFASLAKKVQNMTTFISLHKEEFGNQPVPQLLNTYKCKELLENDVWSDATNLQKPETLQLFSLNSSDGIIMTADEKAKLKEIVNNSKLRMTPKLVENIEKSLKTASSFLDKRTFFQEQFASIFDIIRKPLATFGIKLLPSDIVGTGIL